MGSVAMKVGELARQTEVSVRTLHYYDEIGLLVPSHHTASGHRLYTREDIARLQQIMSLRQLGLSLDEIGKCLTGGEFSPARVIELHIARLNEQIDLEQRLLERLRAVAERMNAAEEVSVDEFLRTIQEIQIMEKYWTPEHLEKF